MKKTFQYSFPRFRYSPISLIFLISFPFTSFAQDYTYDPNKKKKPDYVVYSEGKASYNKVLLIPYKPVMHLPDPAGDVELVRNSQKGIKEIRKQVRTYLDISITEKIKPLYKVMPLLRIQTEDVQRDLDRIYNTVGYKYVRKPVGDKEKKKPILNTQKLFGKQNYEKEKSKQGIVKGQIVIEDDNHEKEYMNVTISDDKLLPYLSNKYGADLFVFINQFEIKKTFSKASDVPYANYEREVRVHYSIIDENGDQLFGDVIVAHILTKTDNINEIIEIGFPQIAEHLSKKLPQHEKLSPEMKLEKEYKKKAEKQDILKPH